MSPGVRPDCVMAFLELERVLDVGFSSYITCSRTGRVCHGAIGCADEFGTTPSNCLKRPQSMFVPL